jgi:hypothetical protein
MLDGFQITVALFGEVLNEPGRLLRPLTLRRNSLGSLRFAFGVAALLTARVEGAACLFGYSYLDLRVLWDLDAPSSGISRLRHGGVVSSLFIIGPSVPPR